MAGGPTTKMTDQIDALRKLQEVDAQLYRLRIEQKEKPVALERLKQGVAEEQAKAQASDAKLKTFQVQQKEKELELSTKEGHAKKLQLQLFQVKTNKEYTALQHEIEQAKTDASMLEEDILKIFDSIEHAMREHHEQQALVANSQASLREEEARINQEITAIEGEIAALQARRRLLAPEVPAAALLVYERVLVSREGLAMVPLLGASCGGCNMVQPPQVINEVMLKAKLVACDSCNRILYLDEQA